MGEIHFLPVSLFFAQELTILCLWCLRLLHFVFDTALDYSPLLSCQCCIVHVVCYLCIGIHRSLVISQLNLQLYRHHMTIRHYIGSTVDSGMLQLARKTSITVQGEHKKVSPTTFVDISAMRGDFCMKFYRTVKLCKNSCKNLHALLKYQQKS